MVIWYYLICFCASRPFFSIGLTRKKATRSIISSIPKRSLLTRMRSIFIKFMPIQFLIFIFNMQEKIIAFLSCKSCNRFVPQYIIVLILKPCDTFGGGQVKIQGFWNMKNNFSFFIYCKVLSKSIINLIYISKEEFGFYFEILQD